MRVSLTDRFCDRITPSERTEYFDEGVSGLALRISSARRTSGR
jgi:hypothetical protein